MVFGQEAGPSVRKVKVRNVRNADKGSVYGQIAQ
jgi:hypothetical protein